MTPDLDMLIQLAPGTVGGSVVVWVLVFLLRRGDSLQRENIAELRRQRDDAFDEITELRADNVRLKRDLVVALRKCEEGDL